MSEHSPAEVFHPGVFIKEEMDARDWTIGDLCHECDLTGEGQSALHDIFEDKGVVNRAIASQLSRAFGTSVKYWLNLQAAHLEHRQRKLQARAEQLQVDVASYNENYNPGEPIEIDGETQ